MASFTKGGSALTPWGGNDFLRSTKGVKTESYTVADGSVTSQTIDSVTGQRILKKGMVLAKITSTADAGKVGPFQGGTLQNETQTITVTASGGATKLRIGNYTTASLAYNANAATIQAAILAATGLTTGDVAVSGTGPFTVTFAGQLAGQNVPLIALEESTLSGGTWTMATTQEGGVATGAATDGRGDPDNIVGINNTPLMWELTERDVEVSVVYDAAVIQAYCLEYDATGAEQALSNRTAAAMVAQKSLNIVFKTAAS